MNNKRELHYNNKFDESISSYTWMKIYQDCSTEIIMAYNRSEDWGETFFIDYKKDFSVHIRNRNDFSLKSINLSEFNPKEYNIKEEDIEFYKTALKTQFEISDAKSKPRDVCSKFYMIN